MVNGTPDWEPPSRPTDHSPLVATFPKASVERGGSPHAEHTPPCLAQRRLSASLFLTRVYRSTVSCLLILTPTPRPASTPVCGHLFSCSVAVCASAGTCGEPVCGSSTRSLLVLFFSLSLPPQDTWCCWRGNLSSQLEHILRQAEHNPKYS